MKYDFSMRDTKNPMIASLEINYPLFCRPIITMRKNGYRWVHAAKVYCMLFAINSDSTKGNISIADVDWVFIMIKSFRN